MSDFSVGIDFGTTNSCVSIIYNDQIIVVPNNYGDFITPSIVNFDENKNYSVGYSAKYKMIKDAEHTITNIKRIIGLSYDDLNQKEIENYKIIKSEKNNFPLINLTFKNKNEQFSPIQIISYILKYLKVQTENYIQKKVKNVIITVPANFNVIQIQGIRDAAKLAELNVIRIIKEPTAAAITYYYYNQKITNEKKIVVFDLGGGTFDISILTLNKGFLEVICTNGDNHLGGDDFDERLVEYCAKIIEEDNRIDIRNNQKIIRRLKIECEKLKKDLSVLKEATIDIDNLFGDNENFVTNVTRADFEYLCDDLFQKTIKILDETLKKAKLKKNNIDDIILVGGSTKIPKIQEYLRNYFGEEEFNDKCKHTINPDTSVAIGAAIQAAIIQKISDQFKINFFVKDIYHKFIAIQLKNDKIYKLIKEFSTIPIEKNHIFQSSYDNQNEMNILIYEGDNNKELRKICDFILEIPKKKKGEVKVNVNVKIDVNSILTLEIEQNFSFNKETIELDISKIEENKINNKNKSIISFETKIEEFKKRINDLEKTLEKNHQNVLVLNDLIKNYGMFLELIDIGKKDNEIFQEDYLIYLNKLITEYINLFKIKNENKDFSKIEYLLEKVKPSQIGTLLPNIKKLKIFKESYEKFILKLVERYKRYYENNIKIAEFCLKFIKNILEDLSEKENPNVYEKINKYYKFYQRRIEALKKIKEGDEEFNKIDKKNDNSKLYSSILNKYQEGLKIIYKKDEEIKDNEYTMICLIRMLIIQYYYFSFNEKKFLSSAYNILIYENSPLFKIKENKKWLDIMKEEKEKIEKKIDPLEQIDVVFESYKSTSLIHFIKFILNQYPVEKMYDFNDLEQKFKNDRNQLISDLSTQYYPDRFINDNNKTINGVTYFDIYKKICSLFNNLINSNNNGDEESTIPLSDSILETQS